MQANQSIPKWTLRYIDMLNERYGGQALSCNDEFFAESNNLVKRSEPVFREDLYTDRGKWMDGWESRRRRTPGHDWCILRLGVNGRIRGFDVNTTFFRGNAPEKVSVDAWLGDGDPDGSAVWEPLLPVTAILPHQHNYIQLSDNRPWSHLRLNIFPDGGVARLRVYGEPTPDWSRLFPNELVDLAASVNGGQAISCSDMFFSPMNNLIAPGRGVNMGDGWETRRRRGPGHDWIIVKLACAGTIARVLLDTIHFKGNYPDSFTLEGTCSDAEDPALVDTEWVPLLPRLKLMAHSEHLYQAELLETDQAFTHVRLSIYPDGGVSRMRVFGYPAG